MTERTLLRIEYVRLDKMVEAQWDSNPKRHDIGAIVQSVRNYGFRDAVIFDAGLNGGQGGIAAGNGRITALWMMFQSGEDVPIGVDILEDDMWAVPVQFGIDSASQAAAEAFALDHNSLVLSGGDYTLLDTSRLYDTDQYMSLLSKFVEAEFEPVSVDSQDMEALLNILVNNKQEELEDIEFPEYDESVAEDVECIICPKCDYKWPK